jgi:uncharacterized protein YkwD
MKFSEPLASPGRDRHSVRVTRRMWSAMLLGLVCLYVGPLPAGAAPAVPEVGEQSSRSSYTTMGSDEFEGRLLARSNTRRAARGCRPLRLNSALLLASRRHSSLMSDQGNLSHRLAGEPDLGDRLTQAGYTRWRLLAENLAWGQATPGAVFRAWVHSPGHRANLDNCRLRDVGFGVVIRNGRPWVTADYGRRRT